MLMCASALNIGWNITQGLLRPQRNEAVDPFLRKFSQGALSQDSPLMGESFKPVYSLVPLNPRWVQSAQHSWVTVMVLFTPFDAKYLFDVNE